MITTVTESEWNLIPVRQNDFQVADYMKSVARLGKYLSLFYEMLYYRRTVEFYKEKIRDAYTNKSGRAVRLSIYTHTLRVMLYSALENKESHAILVLLNFCLFCCCAIH